jgi:nitroimidazol reductase NimA-like FMN-containing flavoprotein (pyridoxamine 5'-phosphate oxidase superfamily)
MLGELTHTEIEHVLLRESIGRIGCHAEGRVYVVPITYAYDGEYVYAHSCDGLKVRTMRENPSVCFEVEQIADPGHWQSVVAWGRYEELDPGEEGHAIALLRQRLAPGVVSVTTRRHPVTHADVDQRRTIHFRILLEEKTGRFER